MTRRAGGKIVLFDKRERGRIGDGSQLSRSRNRRNLRLTRTAGFIALIIDMPEQMVAAVIEPWNVNWPSHFETVGIIAQNAGVPG